MSKKEAKLSCIMIVQRLEPEYWHGWDEDLINSAKNGELTPLLEEVVNRVSEISTVSDAYAINHDKDVNEIYNLETKEIKTEPESPHVHILLKFTKGSTLTNLALQLGIEPQYIEKAKVGKFAYDNLLAYLTHQKEAEKFQYDPKEVITLQGKDYLEIVKERYQVWQQGRVKKDISKSNASLDEIYLQILNQQISKQEILSDPKLQILYALNKTKINEAFMTLGEIKSNATKQALENGEFKKTIIFITGKSGLGKSRFAKTFVKELISLANTNKYRWSDAVTAGTNIFDEVNGEEILLLDDVRGDSLTASDWLKLLDPYNISPISARYHNRMGSARVIVITSTKHPLDFFYHTKGNEKEDLSQFIRRTTSLVTLYRDSPSCETRYFHSSPKSVPNRRLKVPHTDIEIYMSYDFENNSEISKENLLEFLLAQVSINNRWDLDKIKNSSEDTLASNSDEF
ncbi:replication protein [Streptococcus equi subsp. zooepidemicus]|uniref:Rep family protein n=1 Tax=Streptococcus equi TaxID=1336 RepID=UPI0022AB52B0|nr:Rep family protein [Streptococcus equi]MCD3463111.1 replication protein [Streptococcus equi subsp. zooepidemicus]MDI5915178.1 Rep family protein [Streptococcus equi subsp. zooepidemicus]HEL0720234.1 AAA family ATPase [Streptococcus equi subsp. zooepidemicus]HEL0743727.1 AAA family ATPase [Streptococcus equi subsp. zooepidemicus]HEL1161318.1 AAA family ATPase [Streptococcus equi subsp. zooepidemicus]